MTEETTAPSATPQAQSEESIDQSKKDATNIGSSLESSKKRSSMRRLSSSVMRTAARASFFRTKGNSGASVQILRGTTGSNFEGYATVHRGETNLFSCCTKKDGVYFLLIKGYYCFVYKDEESGAPKYAIELMNRKAVIQPSHESFIPRVPHPGAAHDTTYTTIHLETSLGDIEYKLTFANMEDNMASKFCNAVAVASNEASTEQVRKRLGHGSLNKRGSVRYALAIGEAKAKDQPEVPVGAGEVLAGMPSAAY